MFAPTNVMFMACGSFNPPTHMHFRMFGKHLLNYTYNNNTINYFRDKIPLH